MAETAAAGIGSSAGQRASHSGARVSVASEPAPVWVDSAPPLPALKDRLPGKVDVLIVGAGYTGLNAALECARGGRSTLVIDAGDPGAGCSIRNGGQISSTIKPSLASLTTRFGAEKARALRSEAPAALDWIEGFVAREGIDCGFRRRGKFHAAHSPAAYEALARQAEVLTRDEGIEAHVVPRAEQHRELASDFYFGGLVYPRNGSLHPAQYHRGLLARVIEAGATVLGHCAATAIRSEGQGFTVETAMGTVTARDVAIATNGYTGDLTPWLRRRVIPIGSYVIATEEIGAERVRALFPSGRKASDSRRVVYYYGPTPDGRRITFGGRVSAGEASPEVGGPRLRAEMVRIFPQLRDVAITHSWRGFVAYTFDELPHCGTHDGMHYAMGYCGSGVSMASFQGMKMGRRILGQGDGESAFDGLPFRSRPLYRGRPWFLPAAVALYRMRDRAECFLAQRRKAMAEPVP